MKESNIFSVAIRIFGLAFLYHGAINVPLAEVRNMFPVLDRSREYVVYCQSGRRSAAAAFLFAQRGFKVWVLDGGLKMAERT